MEMLFKQIQTTRQTSYQSAQNRPQFKKFDNTKRLKVNMDMIRCKRTRCCFQWYFYSLRLIKVLFYYNRLEVRFVERKPIKVFDYIAISHMLSLQFEASNQIYRQLNYAHVLYNMYASNLSILHIVSFMRIVWISLPVTIMP